MYNTQLLDDGYGNVNKAVFDKFVENIPNNFVINNFTPTGNISGFAPLLPALVPTSTIACAALLMFVRSGGGEGGQSSGGGGQAEEDVSS